MLTLLCRLYRWLTSRLDPTPFMEADVPGFKAEPDEPRTFRFQEPGWAQRYNTANPDLAAMGEKVVAYPPKVEEESAQAWVTAELERRTGGITRHPMDLTRYPTPPSEQDLAAREYVNRKIENTYGSGANARPVARGYFTHGMSMRYLGELLDRARRKDPTLTDEDLMALRSRGLI